MFQAGVTPHLLYLAYWSHRLQRHLSNLPLRGAIASNSSKNTMQGDACLAFRKTSLTPFSDSPTHLDISSGPFTLMKLDCEVVATALAIMVFPVPGGPYNRSPLGGVTSASLNRSACLSGHSIASANSSLTSSRPPILCHLTFGLCIWTSRRADG